MTTAAAIHQQNASVLSALFGQRHDNGLHLGQSKSSSPTGFSAQGVAVSLSIAEVSVSHRGHGFKILGHELEARFHGVELGGAKAAPIIESVPALPKFQPPSPEEVAGKVLGFVEQRLQAEASSGAGQDRLSELLSQARSGIEQGFAEARKQIDDLGLMNDDLDAEIGKSYDLINKGLDGFAEKYLGEPTTTPPVLNEADVIASAPDDQIGTADSAATVNSTDEEGGRQRLPGVHRFGVSAFSGSKSASVIEITTRDGDKVRIQAESLSASYLNFQHKDAGNNAMTSLSAGSLESSAFALSVDGDLDEGEMQALQDLLSQVQGLSDQFFSGDFQGAFQSAMQLGFDGNEIADFSMNLSTTQVRQVSAYQQVAQFDQPRQASTQNHFGSLGQFAGGVGKAMQHASLFAEPVALMRDLLGRLVSAGDEESSQDPISVHQDFFARLLDKLSLNEMNAAA